LKRCAGCLHISIVVIYGNLCAIRFVARPPCASHWHVNCGDRISGRPCGLDKGSVRTKVAVMAEAAACHRCPAKWVSTSDPRGDLPAFDSGRAEPIINAMGCSGASSSECGLEGR
jgi:hypothetical protein